MLTHHRLPIRRPLCTVLFAFLFCIGLIPATARASTLTTLVNLPAPYGSNPVCKLTQGSDGSYTATITLKNEGFMTAGSVKITKSTLGAAATSTVLPLSVGNLAAGSTINASLSYPGAAGMSGQVVTLKVSGTFTGGSFSGSLKGKLP